MRADGQVCVDMGEPVLDGTKVPTTLTPTQGNTVVGQDLTVSGKTYKMTCVGMGNPHAITFEVDGKPIKVGRCGRMEERCALYHLKFLHASACCCS
eukprot:363563-Chlamydomonas_euryale.AAC.4